MKIIALDTVAGASSVAVFSDGKKVCSYRKVLDRGHAEVLIPMMKEAISSASFKFLDLDLIAVTVGPGSFTGIRVGLATARSLSVAAKVPVIGVTSFEAVAASITEKEWAGVPVLIALETRRDDFYLQMFNEARARLGEPKAVGSPDIVSYVSHRLGLQTDILVVGDGAERAVSGIGERSERFKCRLASSLVGPDAVQVAEIAQENHLSGYACLPAEPFYLRAPHVKMPIKSGSQNKTMGSNKKV